MTKKQNEKIINEAIELLKTMKGWPVVSIKIKGTTIKGNELEYENQYPGNSYDKKTD